MKSDLNIQLPESNLKRTHILKSAKMVAEQLQKLVQMRTLRERKKEKILQLNKILFAVNEAFTTLKLKDVPSLKTVPLGDDIVEGKPTKVSKENESQKRVFSGVDSQTLALARELEEIEKKLASLQ